MKHIIKSICALLLAFLMAAAPVSIAYAAPVNFHQSRNNIVCLTIDDGYSRVYIKRALDILRAKKVKCTFFIIGSRLTATPDLWRQAVRDGHEICYHSMSHRSMSSWSKAAILNDIRRWNRSAKSVLGADYKIPKFARLPGGAGQHSARVQRVFDSIGYKLIYWSTDTYTGVIRKSTRNLNSRIAKYIKSTTRGNSIILTHFNSYDIKALPHYIDWLKGKFRLGTVSEAFAPVDPYCPLHTVSET